MSEKKKFTVYIGSVVLCVGVAVLLHYVSFTNPYLQSTTIYLWLISLTASKELSILLLKLYNDGAIGISSSNLGLRVRKLD